MGKKQRLKSLNDLKIGVLGDEQTVTGLILAGLGAVDGTGRTNFHVVTPQTRASDTGAFFNSLVTRNDIGVVLITQTVAATIRNYIDEFSLLQKPTPVLLEIPSKDVAYDAKKDPIMQRVQMFFGSNPVMEMDLDVKDEE